MWKAALWDKPKNGARYYVRRPDPAAYDGYQPAEDERGGVLTFGSRDAADAHAASLNGAEPST